jgi:AcrR family transcriptional regulator
MQDRIKYEQRKAGRPRAYDPDTALQQALETFWAQGFTATSLDQLSRATGMNRPSLNLAFGDKKSIYLQSIARFSDEMRRRMETASRDEDLRSWLLSYYRTVIDIYAREDAAALGCFVLSTAVVDAVRDEDIRLALAAALQAIDAAFEARLRQAQVDGELDRNTDTATLAQAFAAIQHSLSVRARAGAERVELLSFAERSIEAILPRARVRGIRDSDRRSSRRSSLRSG